MPLAQAPWAVDEDHEVRNQLAGGANARWTRALVGRIKRTSRPEPRPPGDMKAGLPPIPKRAFRRAMAQEAAGPPAPAWNAHRDDGGARATAVPTSPDAIRRQNAPSAARQQNPQRRRASGDQP